MERHTVRISVLGPFCLYAAVYCVFGWCLFHCSSSTGNIERIFQRPELRRRCVDMEERVLHVWVSVDTHQYISCPQTSHFLTCVVLYHHRREKTDSDI